MQLVLLSSDGYANSFADDNWEESVGRDLADRLTDDGIESVHEQLPTWLGESAAASGDDVSVVLLIPNHADGAADRNAHRLPRRTIGVADAGARAHE